MATQTDGDTREALLDAAEALFAAEGTENVTLAAITRLAGQRNGGAIHYHFGGRDGLLGAILDRHEVVLDERRMQALIELRRAGEVSVEALVRVVVESLAEQFDSASGRSFLAIQRDRLVESDGAWTFRSATMRLIVAECQALLAAHNFSEHEEAERLQLATQLVIHRLADRCREEVLGTTTPRTLVIETLVSAATSILSAGATET
jgi:AcrR family transcriptional regulator